MILRSPRLPRFIASAQDTADATVLLFGAPFDSSCSLRPGTRFGANAIRLESDGVESYSPYLDADLEDGSFCDLGDLELPFGNSAAALDLVERQGQWILGQGAKPFMLGGEHLLTLGLFRALKLRYPDLHVLHFDAHTDLRENYLGEKLSHASVMRRIWEELGNGRIHAFGIRSGQKTEWTWAADHIDFHPFRLTGLADCLQKLQDTPLFLSFDLDVFDPAYLPGTGTPEAGGVDFREVMQALKLLRGAKLVAADVMELNPMLDPSKRSAALAAVICRELLLLLMELA